jgi:II/X family phage/plasmid replication protein
MKKTSLVFGNNTSRHQIIMYSKGEELEAGKGHQLPIQLLDTQIAGWADDKLRVELRLKRKELDSVGLKEAHLITPQLIRQLFIEYVRRIDMTQQITLTSKQQMDLPRRLRSTYVLWKNGEDLRSTLPHNTYYRHRKELKTYGIDIRLPSESLDRSNVIPIFRFVEAIPVDVPEWAFHLGLVHPSAAQESMRKAS